MGSTGKKISFEALDIAKSLVSEKGFDDEVVEKFLFLTKKKGTGNYFLVKRILLIRCLEEEMDEETIKEVADQVKIWITSTDSTPNELRFVISKILPFRTVLRS